jgi:predicted nucleic acid-binding protein
MSPRATVHGQRYAIDTVILIYFLERHPHYFREVLQIFREIESGEISAVLSSLVFTELLVPAYRANDQQRVKKIVQILTNYPHLDITPLNPEIAISAAQLRAQYQLRTPDAIHAATGMHAKADGIITNDKAFKKLKEPDFGVILLNDR